ncbi:MAG: DUF58 domain-containing protein [Brevinemataceae bacterium]
MNQLNDISISEIVAQTKHLELTARRLVNDSLQNDYKSSFRGRGMEFDEIRSYFPGDNVRDIDWNVTARMNEPFIKTFTEERELTVYLVVDISGSEDFGSVYSKRKTAAEITALLGFTSFFANDKTGLILVSDQIEKTIPPHRNYSNIVRIIRDAYYYSANSKKTDLNAAFRQINNLIKKKAIIFIISDFFDEGYEYALGTLCRKHEVIPIVLRDILETDFSYPSYFPIITELEDMETGQSIPASVTKTSLTDNTGFKEQYTKIFKKLSLEHAEICSDSNYVKTIDKLLRNHARQN